MAALIGQILINNSDILIVKRFFLAEQAGHYAALALIGRVVFFATWSVVATLFPIVAQRQQRGESHRQLLWLSLGLVLAVSVVIIGASLIIPDFIVSVLFGEAYLSVAPLLWLYAVATLFYALSNVVVNYRLSLGSGGGSLFVVVGGVLQVVSLWVLHGTLFQVVVVQIALMGTLFVALLLWDLILARRERLIFARAAGAMIHQVVIPATPEGLGQLQGFVAEMVGDQMPGWQARIGLALHEVCLYILQHGYKDAAGDLQVAGGWHAETLFLQVTDTAPHAYTLERPLTLPANPLETQDFGWGMFVVHEVMDAVYYARLADANRWLLCVTVDRTAQAERPVARE